MTVVDTNGSRNIYSFSLNHIDGTAKNKKSVLIITILPELNKARTTNLVKRILPVITTLTEHDLSSFFTTAKKLGAITEYPSTSFTYVGGF